MMQDFPRLLVSPSVAKVLGPENSIVGFTQLDRFTCFSAAKNNLKDAVAKFQATGYAQSAASAERGLYDYAVKILSMIGVKVGSEKGVGKKLLFCHPQKLTI